MHSFHQSRSRIFFETLCALAISASCVGAWMQTGASALLPAAAVSALYGLIHAFDMVGRRAAVAVEPQRIDFAADDQGDLPACQDAASPPPATDRQLETDKVIEQAELVVPAAPRGSGSRRAKAPRKGGGRRVSAKETKVVDLTPPEEVETTLPVPPEEVAHVALEPLFELDPFVRQQRAVFGRKAG